MLSNATYSILLQYGCETWIINEQEKKKLEAIEIWTWRRLLKVSWTEIKNNISAVLNRGKKRFC